MQNHNFDSSGINAMTFQDVDEVYAIEKECFLDNWSKNSLIESLKISDYNMQVYKKDNRILGYIIMYVSCREGYIYSLGVRKKYRNLGIATMLLKKILNIATKKNLIFLSLEVRISNNIAISLYEKMGFTIQGIRKNFYAMPIEDAIIMTKYF